MEKYEIVAKIGDGTFGTVAKAVCKKDGHLVAIKKMKKKYHSWDECVRLPEVDIVRRIHGHPNVVKLLEVIRENNLLYFVFEFMDGDMLGAIKKAKKEMSSSKAKTDSAIPYTRVRSYMRQLLLVLAYIHKRGYFHRDLKPENLLIKREANNEEVVKLGDFGLVKEIRARPPFTDYVSTRWYRSPELLLQDRAYSSPIDIWAAGCLMAELITTRPLFPGTNEIDQLSKIMKITGAPSEETWAGGMKLARRIHYKFPSLTGSGLAKVMPTNMPACALDILEKMLLLDPTKRPTAEQCLRHPFFEMDGCGTAESKTGSSAQHQLAEMTRRMQAGTKSAPPAIQSHVVSEHTANSPSNEHEPLASTSSPSMVQNSHHSHKLPVQNGIANTSSNLPLHSTRANVEPATLSFGSTPSSTGRMGAKPYGSVENPFSPAAVATPNAHVITAMDNNNAHHNRSSGSFGICTGAVANSKNVSAIRLYSEGCSDRAPSHSREMSKFSLGGTDFTGQGTPSKVASKVKTDHDQALANPSSSRLASMRTTEQLPALRVTGIRPPGGTSAAVDAVHAKMHNERQVNTLNSAMKFGPCASSSPSTSTNATAIGTMITSASASRERSTFLPHSSQEKLPSMLPSVKLSSTTHIKEGSPGEHGLSAKRKSLPSAELDSLVDELPCGFHALDETVQKQHCREKQKMSPVNSGSHVSQSGVAPRYRNLVNSKIGGDYSAGAHLGQHPLTTTTTTTQMLNGAGVQAWKSNKLLGPGEFSNGNHGYRASGLKNVGIGKTFNGLPTKTKQQAGHALPSEQHPLMSPPVETKSTNKCAGICFFH